MLAFDRAFSPCPVYFFYSCNTNAVLHGQLGDALIFDSQRQPVDVRLLAGKPLLVAEMGRGYADWMAATDEEG